MSAGTQTSPSVGAEQPFSIPLIKSQLKVGANTIAVRFYNSDRKTSPTVTLTLNIKTAVNITYKDETGATFTPDASKNAPTRLTGIVGEGFDIPKTDLSPDYSFVSAAPSLTGMYTAVDQNVVLTYKEIPKTSKINISYVDENDNVLTMPAGTKTTDTQIIGSTHTYDVPSLLPLYQITSVTGGTLAGAKTTYNVTYGETDQNIVVKYQSMPQTVTMTVKYFIANTTTSVTDLATKTPVAQETKTVTIGELITSHSDSYKKTFDGYDYVSVTGNTGDVPNANFEVVYFYEGKLSLENVPKEVSFGQTNKLISFGKQTLYPSTPIEVGILDTRDSSSQSWELELSVTKPMQTASNQLLKGELKFNQGGTDMTLSTIRQVVRKQGTKSLGRENLTWSGSNDKGLYLEQQPGNLKDVPYEGTLSWQLTDGL
nr:MucBP domain-containing protein [Vagococcus allomyrinae]